jgi:type IX secretion system PorP/SprF family membrane protein
MGIKRELIICFIALFPISGFAQFDAQRTQYMYSPTAVNPGALASNDMLNVLGVYRLQWAGFSNAPKDVIVSADMPFTIGDTKHGIGVSFQDENIGLFENQTFIFQYAYRFPLWKGNLGLGLNLGFIDQSFDYGKADVTGNKGSVVDGDSYHSDEDPMIPTSDQNDMAFAAGFGAYYSDTKLFIGLSVLNLNRPSFDFGEAEKTDIPQVFYLESGYDFTLSNEDYHMKPSVMLKTDFSSSQAVFSDLVEYKKKYSGGISYRWGDSFDFLIGMRLLDGLFVGYSYDLPVSGMISSGGSHEFCLRYAFKPEFSKKNKYKSERIL